MAEAIEEALQVPVRSVSREEAEAIWGKFLTAFVQFENCGRRIVIVLFEPFEP
jgi:hypothetical protein